MIDLTMMSRLINDAFHLPTRVIFLGDRDHLPRWKPGRTERYLHLCESWVYRERAES